MDFNAILDKLLNWLQQFSNNVASFIPSTVIFLLILTLGYCFSKIIANLTVKIITKIFLRFNLVSSISSSGKTISEIYSSTPLLIGKFIFWFSFFFFIVAGIELLNFPALTKMMGLITFYLPKLFSALLILCVGIWSGFLISNIVAKSGYKWQISHPEYLASILRWFIILTSIAIALSQTGINSDLINVIFGIVLFWVLGTIAISFSLGVRKTLANYITTQIIKNDLHVGSIIKFADYEGKILEFLSTSVKLDTGATIIRIPIKLLDKHVVVLQNPNN